MPAKKFSVWRIPAGLRTHVYDLCFIQATSDITFILEYEQTCTHQTLFQERSVGSKATDEVSRGTYLL